MKKFLSDVLIDCGLTVNGTTSLVGTATATTVATSDNSTKIATTAWVKSLGYTSYSHWNLKTNGVQRTTVTSGGTLDITAGTGVTVSYSAGGVVTINATGSVDYISNVVLNGSSLDFTGVGNAFAGSVDLSTLNPIVRTVYETVKNVSGATILKGTPLAVVPGQTSGNVSDVIPADAADPAKMPAVFIANANIADEAEGEAVLFGYLSGVDTSLYQSGTTVYVAPGGGWTATKPVYPNKIQNLGVITKQHATNGAGIVTGVGRANDLPNLTAGKIWVGTANYPIESTTVHIDETNGRLGVGTTSPDSLLEIENSPAAQSQSRMLSIDNNPTSNQGSGYIEISSGSNNQAKTQIEQVSSGGYGLLGNQYIDTNIINRGLSAAAYGNINFATGSSTSATSIVMTIGGGSQKGNVGIGTTSPDARLEVNTAFTSDVAINANERLKILGNGTMSWGASNDYGQLSWDTGYALYRGQSGKGVKLQVNSSTTVMTLTTDGNVGVGTTSPTPKLHLVYSGGTYTTDATSGFINQADTGRATMRLRSIGDDASELFFDINGGIQWDISARPSSQGNELRFYRAATTPSYSNVNGHTLALKQDGTIQFPLYGAGYLKTDASGNITVDADIIEDTLDSVTDRNAVTTNAITVGGLTVGDSHFIGNESFYDNLLLLSSAGESIVLGSNTNIFFNTGATANNSVGTNRMYVDGTTGNVGIGTTSPAQKLEVSFASSVYGARFTRNDAAGSSLIEFANNTGVKNITGYNAGFDGYTIGTTSATNLIVKPNGNVGIGTTSPGEKLTVFGDNAVFKVVSQTADTGLPTKRLAEFAGIYNSGSNGHQMFISSTGGTGSWEINQTKTWGGIMTFGVSSNGTEITRHLTIANGGNVGIGTTSPASNLHIATTGSSTLTIQNTTNSGNASLKFRDEGNVDQYSIYYALSGNRAYNLVNGNGLTIYSSQTSSEIARFGLDTGYNNSYFNGSVGIGTTSPNTKLHIVGAGSTSEAVYLFGDSNYGATIHYDRGGSYGWRAGVGGSGSSSTIPSSTWGIEDASLGVSRLVVTHTTGNVGIGTTTPDQKLQVVGSIKANGTFYSYASTNANFSNTSANATFHQFESYWNTDAASSIATLRFDVGTWRLWSLGTSSAVLTVKSNGNVGIGNTSPSQKLTVEGNIELGTGGYIYGDTTNPAVYLNNGSGAFLQYTTANRVGVGSGVVTLTAGGGERVRINSTGVGIGTTSPSEKLHVVGNVQIDGSSTSTVLETGDKTAAPTGVAFAVYPIASTYGAIVDYVIYDTNRDNMRTGTFSAVWNTGITNFNDVSTVDIGDTSVVILTSQINGADVELIVSGDAIYTIKFNVKLIK